MSNIINVLIQPRQPQVIRGPGASGVSGWPLGAVTVAPSAATLLEKARSTGHDTAPARAALSRAWTSCAAIGYGPEIFSLPAAPHGAYHVYVNYYGAGELKDVITVAHVAIVLNEGTVHEKLESARVPMRRPGELVRVKSFVYP